MIFDQFAGFIERHEPAMVEAARQIHLFEFPYQAHKIIGPDAFVQEDLDDFILPFPMVAIEDSAGCVILIDSQEKQFGLKSPRAFIDIVPMGKDREHFANHDDTSTAEQRQEAKQEGLHQIAFGELHSMALVQSPDKPSTYQIQARVLRFVVMDKRGNLRLDLNVQDFADPESKQAMQGIFRNVTTAIEELMLAQKDRRLFVLEKAPVRPREEKKGRIARSQDRPKYVLLSPEAIRQEMGIKATAGKGEGGQKAPHERRRHWRTLRSERFTHKQGERILIEAHWVGQSEVIRGGKTRYRVRLDV